MDPQNASQVPGMELPKPQPEVMPTSGGSPEANTAPVSEADMAKAVEQGTTSSASVPFDLNLGPQPAVSTTFDPAQIVPQPIAGTTTDDSMPEIADDNDLIEKEWVDKAKKIVEQTKADPHTQNKEMNKMKADYLKKRYNKDMKLVEE